MCRSNRSRAWTTRRRALIGLAGAGVLTLLVGCETCAYYRQAIAGQYRIVAHRRPIDQVLADAQIPGSVKDKLRLVLRLRAFAESDLKLPANGHYLRYADVGRRYVVWNVHAAPPFSLEPKTWWYPVVGSLEYRGYFSEVDARRYAGKLERKGLEVYVEGVEAYSTLGWFRDPVLSTFIHYEEAVLAETLFHELAHQKLFVGGDTDFDEAFATAVGQEGARRWLEHTGNSDALSAYRVALRREEQFVSLVTTGRLRLEMVYTNSPCPPTAACRQAKEQVVADLRRDYAELKKQWGGYAGFDAWFAQPLNNAQLNTITTYYEWVPAFQRLLRESGGSLDPFYGRAKSVAKCSKAERHRRLAELAGTKPN